MPLFRVTYYRRESDDVVLKVEPMIWDRIGIKHFEEQGYTKEYPYNS